ncbi:shugoshin family protein [Aspergillus clavatus NRRL 1]|uniref:Shugoshin C terminal domain protein n=1 Tax=Aspergillus clavatus (strain ATCC 1007 / CBS 513.65 / DSM 816 / NCTC 3887 / NRRL 1 / QM 1276 / 107) TaxID=344612 RepID=A1CQN5_ASPCL|nr:shugoshin C terminal domain protein [Aspergillus clavatus NRRL 1]EAW07956.1 shugoshin C terminal domain protein [Aspergillus clavatus NRRL 1]
MQSLRIRSLESEVSHLLSENVSLREQVITLSQELERFEAARSLHEGIHNIKSRLDSKLWELNHLVSELGALPRKFAKSCDDSSEAANQGHSRFPITESTMEGLHSGNKAVPEEQGRLPAILEDKCYPRKTLESQEIQNLVDCKQEIYPLQESGEAPSLSGMISDGEISPEDSPRRSEIIETASTDGDFDETALPPTLETRKRKKPNVASTTDFHLERATSSERGKANSASKTGTKRKFSTDCVEEYEHIPAGDDDFQFRRPCHPAPRENDQPVSIRERVSPLREEAQLKPIPNYHDVPRRKVLKPKNANLSNISPKKGYPTDIKNCDRKKASEQKDDKKKLNAVQIKQGKNTQKSEVLDQGFPFDRPDRVELDESDSQNAVEFADHGAQKLRLSSPAISGRQDKNEGIIEVSSVPSRPTRRQRSVVSYAEPNLRDKMRRPTNEFVPAVAREHLRKPPSTDANQDATIGEGLQNNVTQVEQSYETSEAFDTALQKPTAGSTKSSLNTVSRRKRKTIPPKNTLFLGDVDNNQCIAERLVGADEFDGSFQDNGLEHELANDDLTSASETTSTTLLTV